MKTGSLVIRDLDNESRARTKTTKKRGTKQAARSVSITKKTKTTQKAAPKKTPNTKTTAAKRTKKTVPKKQKIKKTTTAKTTPAKKSVSKEQIKHTRVTNPPTKRQPLGHLLVEQLLRENGFRGGVSSNKEILDRYSTDESIFSVRPQIIIQPRGTQDVEIAVRVLGDQTKQFTSLSLTPRAAGTGLSGGSLTDSVVIDVAAHMNKVTTIKTDNNGAVSLTAQPGAPWVAIEKKLKKHKVYLPSYPASKDLCSIGGSIANNAAGPDSLRFGHCADWVESLDVTLYDGNTYTLKPITYREFKALTAKKNALATILKEVLQIVEKNEKQIQQAKPKTKKNTAGFPLWSVFDGPVSSFKRGKTKMDLTRLISGSQGTIGIVTSVTMRTEPINNDTELIAVPVFDLQDAGAIILKALDYEPINIEMFDSLSFDLALQHPDFFRSRLHGMQYYRVLLSMYTTYHVRWARKIPEFTILITLDKKALGKTSAQSIVKILRKNHGSKARLITNPTEHEMYWQIRCASYSLSKFQDKNKRPAAFLEDMTVPPKHLPKFFREIRKLLKKYNVSAAVHGHGGNGHLHFYPLLDFSSKATPALVEKMSQEFFDTAVKFEGNICGEHNDGIIRTPHLSKMFSKHMITLFEQVEHVFDPDDIFNPGKKVHPRFDIKENIRTTN